MSDEYCHRNHEVNEIDVVAERVELHTETFFRKRSQNQQAYQESQI